ncbi:MAG: metallophosphoesterase, partial [Verrucomicrobiales bacterium]|nr:metallophosphoesterase [Verrucomicrobiales bacterium]
HPPYSKGGHNSDSSTASGGRLKDMREIFVPIIEDYGVDLVLSGHSHTYQRSHLIDGHYGTSDTLDPATMILDAGDGDLAGDGAYLKQPVPHDGAIYTVAGSTGKVDSAAFTPHPVMHTTLLELGSMIIDVSGNQMDVTFLNDNGSVSDSFAIVHGTEQPEGVPETLIPFDDTWAYLDNGSNQGSGENAAWQLNSFDDSSWGTGVAQLGYGGNGEDTTISFGGDSANKHITTYFRKTFDVTDPSSISALTVDVVRDDGAIVYLNGTEIFRTNMPAGTASYTTRASSAVGGSSETSPFSTSVDSSLLATGTNTIAVEIHQANPTSSDLSFNLRLREAFPSLTREPYLQLASEDGVTIRWQTNLPTDSVVYYGTNPASLDYYTSIAGPTSDHSVELTGLNADTTYYYSVGSSANTFATGPGYFFETHPAIGSQSPTRIWVLGDSGTANANAAAVRDAYTAYNGSPHADVLLMLSDNAYNTGTSSEYQAAVFDMYPETLRNTPLWSTLGNHDAGSATSSNQSGVYYDIFDFPTNAEAGGVPSGTEAYYSFDHANIHFVCLNSQDVDRTGNGAMADWLVNDLSSTTQEFIIAFWHHPPYSKGSHNSDSEARLVEMRQVFVPILENYGVDLVLGGHSHSYERSMLIDGHTGDSSTFDIGTMAKDSGDGDPGGDGAYNKEAAANDGAVYAVAGSSGKITNATLNHPVMITNLVSLGSMVIDVDGTEMDINFIDSTGAVLDTFAIHHTSSQPNTAPALTQNTLTIDEGASVVL